MHLSRNLKHFRDIFINSFNIPVCVTGNALANFTDAKESNEKNISHHILHL